MSHNSQILKSQISNRRRGFTLLELVLALAITVIVGTILGTSLYAAFRAKTAIETAVDATRATDVAADLLAHELALAQSPTPPANSTGLMGLPSVNLGQTATYLLGPFTGDNQSLDFFLSGTEPKADLQSDIREVRYLLVNDDKNNSRKLLVRRVRTNLLEPTPTDGPDQIVAADVLQFTVKYYDGTSWFDTWDSALNNNRIPVAVQFTLELAPIPPATKSRLDSRTVPLPCAVPPPPNSSGIPGGLF